MLRTGRGLRGGAIAALLIGLTVLAGCGRQTPTVTEEAFATTNIVINRFIGTLVIETVDAPGTTLTVSATAAQRDLLPINAIGDTLTIDWEGEPDEARSWFQFWRGRGSFRMADLPDYPTLTLRVPRSANVQIEDIMGRWNVGNLTGDLAFSAVEGEGALGDAGNARLVATGSADIIMGAVAGTLDANVSGDGVIRAESAGTARLDTSGSGDIIVGPVAGDVAISVSGSGSVGLGSITGTVTGTVSGSGDLAVAAISGGITLAVQGSGDAQVDSINGPFVSNSTGSGQIVVLAGRASSFEATLTGSGDVRFGGTAVDPVATLSGSGDVHIAVVEGAVTERATGSGRVRVGG